MDHLALGKLVLEYLALELLGHLVPLVFQDPLEYQDLEYQDLGKLALLSDLLLALLSDLEYLVLLLALLLVLEYLDLGYLDLLVYQDLAYLALENLDRLHQGYSLGRLGHLKALQKALQKVLLVD